MSVDIIRHTTLSNVSNNIDSFIDATLIDNEIIGITTDLGNVIMMNEDNYKDLLLTLEVYSNKNFTKSLIEATQDEDLVDESEVSW